MNYEGLLRRLNDKTRFAFARVGDGEMACMDKQKGTNTDGHVYYRSLGDALRMVYKKKRPYFVGLQPTKHGLYSSFYQYPQEWINADILHEASINGHLLDFVKALHKRNVVMVGNELHQKLSFVNIMVTIPERNAWRNNLEIISHLDKICNQHKKNDLVILFSAGLMSGVLIDMFYEKYKTITCIDTGSVFEPYLGKSIRKYHDNIILREQNKK